MADRLLFFATDVHGSERCFRKWLNAAEGYGADLLVMGGDLTGKVIVPVHRSNGGFVARWRDRDNQLDGRDALVEFERLVADTGAYTWVCEREEAAQTFEDEAATERLFTRLAAERIAEWVQLADARLSDGAVRAFIIAGNDDPHEVDEALDAGRALQNADHRITWLDDWLPMLSLGDSTPTPWNSPREIDEDEYERELDQLVAQLDDPRTAVFNLHVPPYDSSIDLAPELDAELRVRYTSVGEPRMAPVGGKAVRAAIERHQPLVGLHGHVHEARGRAKIGQTACFNPGSVYQRGVLSGVLLRISQRKGVRDYTFTNG
jgi:Icc-related predicted phosphoesterase